MLVEDHIRASRQFAKAMRGNAATCRSVSQAKNLYVKGDIDVNEFERLVQDVLDGTAEWRHRDRMARRCEADGHTDIEIMGSTDRSCAVCGRHA